jgi:hypothetical protein
MLTLTDDRPEFYIDEHLAEAMDNMIYRLGLLRVRKPDFSDLPEIPSLEPITRRCQEIKDEPREEATAPE